MLSDWLFAAGVALLLFGTVLAMVLVAQWGVYALRRRRQIKRLQRQILDGTVKRIDSETVRLCLDAASLWAWPQFPETLAAKIEEQR